MCGLYAIYGDEKPENCFGYPIIYYDREKWQVYITPKDVYLVNCGGSRVRG